MSAGGVPTARPAAADLTMNSGLNAILVGSLSLGGLLALVGVGFNLIFRTTKVVNFAQGSFLAFGAYLASTLLSVKVLNAVTGTALTLVVAGVLGVLVYYALVRTSLGAEEFAIIILTFGLSIVVMSAISLIWGTTRRTIDLGIPRDIVNVAGLRIDLLSLVTFLVALAVVATVALVMRFSRIGVQARAISQNPWLAAKYGISVDRIGAMAWAVSLMIASAAGILYGALTGVELSIAAIGLVVFPAIMLGGLDSLLGALVGGLIVGAVITSMTYWFGPDYAQIIAYGLLIVSLVFLPQGIFGQRAGRTV